MRKVNALDTRLSDTKETKIHVSLPSSLTRENFPSYCFLHFQCGNCRFYLRSARAKAFSRIRYSLLGIPHETN